MANAEQFRSRLETLLADARSQGRAVVDINAGELHRALGGYPGPHHSMPVCCSVMRAIAANCIHEVLCTPPSGKGATLTIRYHVGTISARMNRTKQVSTASVLPPTRLVAAPKKSEEPHEGLPIRMLVVGSCTGEKNIQDCPCLLTAAGLQQSDWRARLQQWQIPAAQLYSGPQHIKMMRGVRELRSHFGEKCCGVQIISAGYGLVSEHQPLVPYEVTFSGRKPGVVMREAERLQIATRLRLSLESFPLVVFLLGKEYLYSTHPPLQPHSGQRFLYFASEDSRELVATEGATIALSGKDQARIYGASTLSLKGRQFELLAQGIVQNPESWEALLEDESPRTATMLMEIALGSTR